MRSITAGSMAERPSSFMPEMKLPGRTLNSRKIERRDGEQRRDDVGEAAAEDDEHCWDSKVPRWRSG